MAKQDQNEHLLNNYYHYSLELCCLSQKTLKICNINKNNIHRKLNTRKDFINKTTTYICRYIKGLNHVNRLIITFSKNTYK